MKLLVTWWGVLEEEEEGKAEEKWKGGKIMETTFLIEAKW